MGLDRGVFLQQIRLDPQSDISRYPFNLPAVLQLANSDGLELTTAVTFLVGDNGTGKSTLIEAIAIAAQLHAAGGSGSMRFETKSTESTLGNNLSLRWGARKPRDRYFLRAESFYNVASEIDRQEEDRHHGALTLPSLLSSYGGRSLHERSHGEAFLDLAIHRFRENGLYLLDEPEAALSVRGCLALLRRIEELVERGSQFIIATHSPVLLAAPGARILQLDLEGVLEEVEFDEAEPVTLTRGFLADPDRFLRHLFAE